MERKNKVLRGMDQGSLKLIGNTPLIKLQNIEIPNNVEIWLKYEAGNPTGSYKDRMALSVLTQALKDGFLKKGERIIEYTGGSTGSSLAFVSACLGLNFTAIFSDAFSDSKRQTMEAFGANVIIEKSNGKGITPELIGKMKEKAYKLSEEPNSFYADQFGSENVLKGYIPLGQEIKRELDSFDVFCASVGTGGAIMGTWEGLDAPSAKLVAFEPLQSPFMTTGKGGAHKVEGIGVGFEPPFIDRNKLNDIHCIDQDVAFEMCRKLAQAEGIFCGGSTGMNVSGAIEIAKKLKKGSKIVTLACDNGLKYLNSHIYS